MSSKAGAEKGLRGSVASAKIRVLLTLWDMGAAEAEVNKGELTERVTRTNERALDYQNVLEQLQEQGAIAIDKNKLAIVEPTGLQVLEDGLKNPEFEFEGQQVGTKLANAALHWIRQKPGSAYESSKPAPSATEAAAQHPPLTTAVALTPGQPPTPDAGLAQQPVLEINNYEEFKQEALEVYEHLNRDYNLDNLVPIYRLRRQMGNKVSRSEFNDWMFKLQESGIFKLQGGEMSDLTPDKKEDSLTTQLGELRYYATRNNSHN